MNKQGPGQKFRLGFLVFGALLVIEVIEFAVGVNVKRHNWPFLAILAVIGAWPILRYFMHLPQLWRRKE